MQKSSLNEYDLKDDDGDVLAKKYQGHVWPVVCGSVGDDDGDCHLLLLGGRLVVVVVDGGVGRAQAIFQLVVSFF